MIVFVLAPGKHKVETAGTLMTIPIYDLTHSHANEAAGLPESEHAPQAHELERRVRELLNEWLRHYFTGQPFESPDPVGGVRMVTLPSCRIEFGYADLGKNPEKPLLHVLLVDRRDGDGEPLSDGRDHHEAVFTWNALVRTHPQAPVMPGVSAGPGTVRNRAEQDGMRAADGLAWLLRSPHVQDLGFKGLLGVRVLSGPQVIQSGEWVMYQIVWSCRVPFQILSGLAD